VPTVVAVNAADRHGRNWFRCSTGGCLRPVYSILTQACGLTPESEVGAVCGKTARTDLCGGQGAIPVPTATEGGGEGKGQDGIGLSDNQAVAEQREYPEWILPHSEFGDPECPGLFFPVVNGEQAEITCNDCGLILKSVPAADVRRTLDEMQLTLAVASEICPHCGSVNLFPGFDRMFAFTCRFCGKVARLADDPNIQRFFGPDAR
jgi:hypothetical protein